MGRSRRRLDRQIPRFVLARPPARREQPSRQTSVIVKFDDGVRIQDWDNLENELETKGFLSLEALRRTFDGITIRRLYSSVGPAQLEALVERAVRMDSDYRPPNLLSYFVIENVTAGDPEELAATLRRLPRVAFAHVTPGANLPICIGPNSFTQGFHGPAPIGIDAQYAWTVPGGDGDNQSIVDLEGGWMLDHNDLKLVGKATTLCGQSYQEHEYHGTAVLGVITALDDCIACVGIAPKATVGLVSIASDIYPHWLDAAKIPNAIATAAQHLSSGHVLLLEVDVDQEYQGVVKRLPCEALPECFAAIRLASALGIIVIEAAGSNDVDLDTFTPAGASVLDPLAAGFEDSRAIMVGGASSTDPHVHLDSVSAHGRRIDCYGWADSVTTCWANAKGSKTIYTQGFNATSAAAAIVAGAALSTQGMMEQEHGRRFSPFELREVLRDPKMGTKVTGWGTKRRIPDLRRIAEDAIGIAPGS